MVVLGFGYDIIWVIGLFELRITVVLACYRAVAVDRDVVVVVAECERVSFLLLFLLLLVVLCFCIKRMK